MKRMLRLGSGVLGSLAGTLAFATVSLPAPNDTETVSSLLQRSRPYLPKSTLPLPSNTVLPARHINLREALLLALRSNQNIKSSELQRIVDKYAVILAKQVFRPQYTFQATEGLNPSVPPAYTFTPNVSLLTPIGSQFNMGYSNNLNGGPGGMTFSWEQPLMKGFGAVNTVGLYDAFAGEEVAKLSFKSNMINDVVAVISAYRALIEDYRNLVIQKRTLRQSEESLKHYELKVKVGKMAPSDLFQQKATVETTRLALVQQENSLQQNYQSFLSTLGLLPNANLKIDTTLATPHFPLPNKEEAIQRALHGNIAYRQALIGLGNTRRALITARDGRKWTLNVTGSAQLGQASNPIGIRNPGSGPSLLFDLEIPIDNVQGKADEINAKVALEQAKLLLEQQRLNLRRQVITQLQTVESAWEQIKVSRAAVASQVATLNAARLKLRYGRSSVFEVTQDQNQLLSQQTALIGTEIAYLNSVTALHKIWGDVLDVWSIQLRY